MLFLEANTVKLFVMTSADYLTNKAIFAFLFRSHPLIFANSSTCVGSVSKFTRVDLKVFISVGLTSLLLIYAINLRYKTTV
jgi:hypothetical protein